MHAIQDISIKENYLTIVDYWYIGKMGVKGNLFYLQSTAFCDKIQFVWLWSSIVYFSSQKVTVKVCLGEKMALKQMYHREYLSY